MQTVTDRFRRWLQLSRFTQSEVADQLGHHRSFVTRLKTGEIRPTLDDAVRLEALTGIPAGAWAAPMTATKRAKVRGRGRNSLVA